MTADATEIVRRYFEEIQNRGALDRIDALFAPGPAAEARAALERTRTAFPDGRVDILDQVAEGDRVAVAWILSGTHHGVWDSPVGPVAPTGRPVRYGGATLLRVAGGRIVEIVASHHDHLGLLQQLGILPDAARRPGA